MLLRSAGSEAKTQVETTELRNRVPPDQLLPNYRRLDFQTYQGVIYSRKMWTKDMVTQLEKLKDLPLRDDDVIVFGHPRSGNNWTLEIVNMILSQTIQYNQKHLVYHLIEYSGDNVQEIYDKFPSPRCLCSHIHATHLPKQVYEKKLKVVYLLRNPKDTLTSYYKVGKCSSNAQIKLFSGEFDEFLQATLENKTTWNSWFDHVLAMERYQEEYPEVPVYGSLFEDKKLRPVEAIRSLCAFLGKPDTMAELDSGSDVTRNHEGKNQEQPGQIQCYGHQERRRGAHSSRQYWRLEASVHRSSERSFQQGIRRANDGEPFGPACKRISVESL